MLPIYYETEAPVVDKDPVTANINDSQESNVKTIERPFDEGDSKEYMPKYDKGTIQEVKKVNQCQYKLRILRILICILIYY